MPLWLRSACDTVPVWPGPYSRGSPVGVAVLGHVIGADVHSGGGGFHFLLTGTGWSTKAEEVMTRVFAQMREHSEKYEVHIGTLNNNGTLNKISGSSVQLPDCGPGLPKIAQ